MRSVRKYEVENMVIALTIFSTSFLISMWYQYGTKDLIGVYPRDPPLKPTNQGVNRERLLRD